MDHHEGKPVEFTTTLQLGEQSISLSRRTVTDEIFDKIYSEIISLRLMPGTKLSEIEIAKQFDVSRQPVREAFIRLSNMNLLLVRPQRATIVRKLSHKEIAGARFIRTAIEVEVVRIACKKYSQANQAEFEKNIASQKKTVDDNDFQAFRKLDEEFHKLLCNAAGQQLAYSAISHSKAQIDRLCSISLSRRTEFEQVYLDHCEIFELLKKRDVENLTALIRKHLSRIDATIEEASRSNIEFFED